MSSRTHKTASVLGALAVLVLVGWADYATGYEISLAPLYALPIAWVTWRVNLGWGLAFSLLSRGLWLYADLASGDHYRESWHAWEKAGTGLIMMVFVAVSFHIFKRTLQRERMKTRQMRPVLPICTSCSRVEDADGYWMEVSAFFRDHTASQPQPKLCPNCARAHYLSAHGAES